MQGKSCRLRVPGLSSEEDSGDNSEDDLPVKRQFFREQQVQKHFSNPLKAAKESGFQYDKNYWLEGKPNLVWKR